MLSLALLLVMFYCLHLFLKWLLSNKRGKWVAITLFILHRIMYLMMCLHDINMPQRVQWYPFFGRYFIFFKWKIIQWEYKDKDEFTIY